jgi:hypothetical protein
LPLAIRAFCCDERPEPKAAFAALPARMPDTPPFEADEAVAGAEEEVVAGAEEELVAGAEEELVAGAEEELVAGAEVAALELDPV